MEQLKYPEIPALKLKILAVGCGPVILALKY